MRMLLFLVTLAAAPLSAGDIYRIRWEQSPQAFAGLHAVVKLTSGEKIEGHWSAVTTDTFTLDVTKTSNKQSIPKGMRTLPRAAIQEVRVGKRRVRGRVIGTTAGLYLPSGIAAAAGTNGEVFQGPLFFALAGSTVCGYFLGKSFDHATHPVEFIP